MAEISSITLPDEINYEIIDSGARDLINEVGNKIYPVGSVYIAYNDTSPASRFGGTGVAITGRFPYFNAGTATGGSNNAIVVSHSHTASAANTTATHAHTTTVSNTTATHAHTATCATDGAHTHTLQIDNGGSTTASGIEGGYYSDTRAYTGMNSGGAHKHSVTIANGGAAHKHTVTVANGGAAHSHTITVNANGSAGTNANMPAYQTLYAGRRTK